MAVSLRAGFDIDGVTIAESRFPVLNFLPSRLDDEIPRILSEARRASLILPGEG